MNNVQCTIPAEVLRYTAMALYELVIRKQTEAGGYPDIDGKINPEAVKLLEQSVSVGEVANFYRGLYQKIELEAAQ